jgi:hypothetical protein
MKATFWRRIRNIRRAELFSPADLLQRAVVIGAVFFVVHLAGLREYTSVLNGTAGPDAADWASSTFFGVTYVIIYLTFVVLAPVLVLAAGLLVIWNRARNGRSDSPGRPCSETELTQ